MLLPILLLAAAGFTILTTEFVIVGLLPALAADLQVSVAQAGLLVSLFAFSVAAFGPFLTAALAGVERKRLFVACLLLFAAANALAAVAGDIWTMAVARFVPALALPVFWAMASETAAHLADPSREGRAVALVFFGIVAATVLGIPIGTLIADAWSWRLAFAALAALALAKALLLAAWLPRIPGRPGVSLRSQASVLRQPLVLGHLLLSLLVFTGMFTPYTYLADILQRLAGFSGSLVGWTLMGFGAVGLLGNWLGGRLVDRSPLGATLLFVLLMALGMLALVPTLGNAWLLAATLATWGVAQAALFIVGQVRVMKSAPRAPAFAASLNISACNAGIGIGALAGSRVIDGSGLAPLGEVGALVCLAAMAVALLLMLAPRQAATEPSLGGQIPH
ncbi:MFS transporter [Pseudomonas aeruginosa]|uniref:MFS transporter n=1 Tax=Pseudomonas aeruginosa TaxID=287 RepID=UPI0034592EB8